MERWNLIDVERDPKIVLKDVYKHPNRYRVNAFYSEGEESRALEQIREEMMVGKKNLHQAQQWAAKLNQPHDPEVIRKILVLIEQYGKTDVQKALRITCRFKPQFALRTIHHTAGILRNWAAGIRR
ncbi:hypothetical protein N9K06_01135 [Omnitrophica bacterium]|nr:hypothetical protein [Candidatus Omnitrophota bacterium]